MRSIDIEQVTDTKIVIAVDPPETSGEDLNLPDRCRVVKLANSVTYDRYVKSASSQTFAS